MIELTALVPHAVRARVAAEVTAALDAHAVRRDLRIPATGNSPRRYGIVGRDTLVATAPAAAAFYRDPRFLAMLEGVVGEPIEPVPYVPEELIATRLERPGDTHGWHWDDYAYAVVWVLRAPPPECGAALEYVRDVAWDKGAPALDALLAERRPARAYVKSGTVYVLRSDTTLHRVSPLLGGGPRDALCFSYAAARERSRAVTHETLDAILRG